MKTSNNSVNAILFTIILFIFIIFISLFKGINLYNINLKNIYINHLFIKIHNKIVLKLTDVKINNTKNYSSQALNLHKTLYTTIKWLKIFEKIEIDNLLYDNVNIKKITLKKNNLKLNTNFLKFSAIIRPEFKNSFINFEYIYTPYATVKDFIINFNWQKNFLRGNGFGYYNNKKISFSFMLNNKNILKSKIYSDNLEYRYKNILFKTKNLYSYTIINLNNFKTNTYIDTTTLLVHYGKTRLTLNDISLTINNNKLKLKTSSVFVPRIKNLENLLTKNIYLFYDFQHLFGYANIDKINANYKNFYISLNKTDATFKNTKNFTLKIKNITIKNKNYKTVFNNNFLTVFNNYVKYSINNGEIKSTQINLHTSKITGNILKILIPVIQGKVYGFKTKIINTRINIINQTASTQKVIYNQIKAQNIKYAQNRLTFNSNALFDHNLKQVITKFLNVPLPVTQINGFNDINGSVFLNKQIKLNINVNTKFTVLDIFGFKCIVPKGSLNITEQNLTFLVKKSKFYLINPLKIGFKGEGLLPYEKQMLLLDGLFDFKIKNLINLVNFKDLITIDFNNEILKTKNISLFVNFKNNQLIISNLKKILKYTTLKKFIDNGIILINFSKYTNILTYIDLKLPVLLQHSNGIPDKHTKVIKKVFFNVYLIKNQIHIFNKYLNVHIKNNEINADLKNLDINLYPLERLLLKTDNNNTKINYHIVLHTTNGNILYQNHKFLSQKAKVEYKNNNIYFTSKYKQSSINGYTKYKYFLLEGKNFDNEEFRAFLPRFNLFTSINLDFVMVKSPENFYTGKIYINKAVVKELKTLNNIIAFINTIPSLLSLSSPGFTSKGYKINNGYVNYLYYKNILYIKQAKIFGDNIDFYAKGYIDFNKNYIFLKVTANLKMKIKKIPIIGKGLSYLLFGKDGSIDIKMLVKGDLNNPKVEKDIGKEIMISPFKLFKRALTLPFNLF